jgi:hypothetical protein
LGTDIHGVLESRYRDDSPWYFDGEIESGRNYRVFAALAGVRNGAGFAGVKTHEPITPIAEPRGWPEDFDEKRTALRLNDYRDDEEELWLGDHSFSWLSLDEILNWDGWDQPLNECGYISREEFEKWDGNSPPSGGWCGGISGRDVITADAAGYQPEGWTHIRVYWSRPFRESCKTFLAWVEYAKTKTAGQQARIIFGFDS